jgi:hypothetical protein
MLVDESELLERFGFRRPGDLRKCLDAQHIPYFYGRGGKIVTTIQALNNQLIDKPVSVDNGSITFT